MGNFTPGQRVNFNTNFYAEEAFQRGVGVVDRVEECQSGAGCKCGVGGTVFVAVEGSNRTLAYVAKELSPA